MLNLFQNPCLRARLLGEAEWMLKQVQHDEAANMSE